MQIDLLNLDKGVQRDSGTVNGPDSHQTLTADGRGWFQRSKDTGKHLVFPAAFLSNSETGHGGLNVQVGLYEAVCDNTCKIGQDFARRHIGRDLEEGDLYSSRTMEKMNVAIFAKVADTIRAAFDPTLLLENAKKMKGLQDVEVEDVKDAVSSIVQLDGITEGVRDDIFAAYKPLQVGRDTLLDVQRAVTASAHAVRESDADLADNLEQVGGNIVERGLAALTA